MPKFKTNTPAKSGTKTPPAPVRPGAVGGPNRQAIVPRVAPPAAPVPVTSDAAQEQLEKECNEIGPGVYSAIRTCVAKFAQASQSEVMGYWTIGTTLNPIYTKHQRNNRVTSIAAKALDVNDDYIRAAMALAAALTKEELTTALAACSAAGRPLQWSVLKRLTRLQEKKHWQRAIQMVERGVLTSQTATHCLDQIEGIARPEAPAQLPDRRSVVRPSAFSDATRALRDKLIQVRTYVSVDGGAVAHLEKLLEPEEDRWTASTLTEIDTTAEQLAQAARAIQDEVERCNTVRERVKQTLERTGAVRTETQTPLPAARPVPRAQVGQPVRVPPVRPVRPKK